MSEEQPCTIVHMDNPLPALVVPAIPNPCNTDGHQWSVEPHFSLGGGMFVGELTCRACGVRP